MINTLILEREREERVLHVNEHIIMYVGVNQNQNVILLKLGNPDKDVD